MTSPHLDLPARFTGKPLFIAVTLGMALLFATANLPWTLDDYDQAKQAFIPYQMAEQHRWLFQTTPTEGLPALGERHSPFHISTKPPAVGWLSAGLYLLLHSWDLAWRLPSFLAALALATLIFWCAKQTFGDFAAVIALAAFAFNMLSPRLATLVRTDMPLAFATFAAGAIMFVKVRTGETWTFRDRTLLFGFLTAGLFIKGPIIYAFVLPPLLIYQLWRNWRPDFPSVWSGWWPWISSGAAFLAWVTAGTVFVPGFYHDVVQVEFVGRFHEGVHRSQPLLFYIPHLLQKFAPWSIAIIILWLVLARARRGGTGQSLGKTFSPNLVWLVAWAFGGIAILSLIPSKRVDRIFPAIPPLCILVGAQMSLLRQRTGQQTRVRRIGAILVVLSGVFIGSYTAVRIVEGYRHNRDVLEKFGSQVRESARREGLRYEILRVPDEGLLLYLQRPQFFSVDRAEHLWRSGAINGLVARQSDATQIAQWPEVEWPPRIQATKNGYPPATYVFVTRRQLVNPFSK